MFLDLVYCTFLESMNFGFATMSDVQRDFVMLFLLKQSSAG